MVRICQQCRGRSDNYNLKLKRCGGCQQAYYCSTMCQRRDWVVHIFDCKPNRPINTADHLALAIRQSTFPVDGQTCEDYGFYRVLSMEDSNHVLGLYHALLDTFEVPPRTIHDWRVRGVLADKIKETYYIHEEFANDSHLSWFLQNEHVIALAGRPICEEIKNKQSDEILLRAWQFIGGSEHDNPQEALTAMHREPIHVQHCFALYILLLTGHSPRPGDASWIEFGFASSMSQEEMVELGNQYRALIKMCTFGEFCNARAGGRLLNLFRSRGLQVKNNDNYHDLCRGPRRVKSVWLLKEFVLADKNGKKPAICAALMEDYGFMNCHDESEVRQLKNVYKTFFKHHGDPMALHEAAMRRDVHGFLSKQMKGLRAPKFRRLMKNRPFSQPNL